MAQQLGTQKGNITKFNEWVEEQVTILQSRGEHFIFLPLDMYVPYVNCKSWTFSMTSVKCGKSVCLMCENYVVGNLLEDQELDGNAGNLPRLILVWR